MKRINLTQLMRIFAQVILLAVILLSGSRQAQAHCWCTDGASTYPLPCWFWWQYTCDGYDQELSQVGMSEDPTDKEAKPSPENDDICSGDPVYLHSGEFLYQCNDLQVPGRELDVEISHTYYSGKSFNGSFGYGWVLNYNMRLHRLSDGGVIIVGGDGRKTPYTFDGTKYVPDPGRFEVLEQNPDSTWTLTLAQGEQYHFDAQGKLVAIADRNNNTITLTYEDGKQQYYGPAKFMQDAVSTVAIGLDYRLTQITDTTGRVIQLTYNAKGLLEKIIDGTRETVFTYDPDTNDMLSVTKPATAQFPDGVTKSFTYEDHNIKQIRDPKLQYFVENFYDDQGRVQQQDLGGSSFLFDYSVEDQVTETDREGTQTTYAFNAAGNMISKEEFTSGLRASDPASFVTSYAYNIDMLKTSKIYPKGNGVVFTYDELNPDPRSRGNLLATRRKSDMSVADNDSNDIVTSMTYDPQFNQVKSMTDPKGEVTYYIYDYELDIADPKYGTNGNLIFIDYPEVAAGTPGIEFSYNTYGQVTEIIDPNNNVTTYDYDPSTGYLKDIYKDPAGVNARTNFTYDSYGQLDLVTDANNHTTDYDYDELGWLTQVTDALGYVTKHFYDANGNVLRTERQSDEAGTTWQVTEFTYDIFNNLKTVNDPLGRTTTYNYDNNEKLASIVDAELNTTTYVHDERDLLFTVTDANTPAGVTTYDYDTNGNLAKITDAENNATNYTYDLFGRLKVTMYADLSFSEFDYDKNSNITRHTTPSLKPIEYDYDELNRLVARRYPLTPELDTDFTYDLGLRMTDADNTASQVHFNYDALNRTDDITQTLNTIDYTIAYNYDNQDNRTQMIYPQGKNLEYVYDDNDRLDIIKQNAANFVDFDYDPLGRKKQKSYLAAGLPLATYDYDLADQLTNLTNIVLPATAISQYAYPLYDNIGNRKQLNRTLGMNPAETINYAYNNIYELTNVTGAQTNAYDYDNIGNRILADGIEYTPNNLNQYIDVGGTAYLYDPNGNLTYDGTNTYIYDKENRLTTFTDSITTASYTYDPFNRRASKTVDGVTTYFVYDGDEVIAEYDDIGTLTAEYVHGPTIDEVRAMERDGNIYYYHYDGLGSVAEITDASGTIVESYEYTPYGEPTIYNSSLQPIAQSAIRNPYMFTGRRWDEENEIYYYRARMYHPGLGRFLQRDPLGHWDSMNLYQYTSNNPINYVDPYGLWTFYGGGSGSIGAGMEPDPEYDNFGSASIGGYYNSQGKKGGKFNTKEKGIMLGGNVGAGLVLGFTKGNIDNFKGKGTFGGFNFFFFTVGGVFNSTGDFVGGEFSIGPGFGFGSIVTSFDTDIGNSSDCPK